MKENRNIGRDTLRVTEDKKKKKEEEKLASISSAIMVSNENRLPRE